MEKAFHHLTVLLAAAYQSYYLFYLVDLKYMSKSKIVKAGGAEPDDFEKSVAQEFQNLEVSFTTRNIYIFKNDQSLLIMRSLLRRS